MQTYAFRFVSLLLCLVTVMFVWSPSVRAEDEPYQGFNATVQQVMQDSKVPGVAIAIVKDDQIVFARGYGVRKLGSPEKVDEHTVFAVGSNTKAFTAALVGMLVDEGKMKWDGRVSNYLQGFEFSDPYVTRAATISDLLSHRAGLPDMDLLWFGSSLSRPEILSRVRFQPLAHGFRDFWDYQNVMFMAAGEAAASVSGKSWDEMIKERIFAPLGMKSSSTSTNDLGRVSNLATPHARVGGKLQSIEYRNIDNIAPAGAINSNVIDMAQWIRMQLGRGKYAGKQLVSEESIETMWSPLIDVAIGRDMVKAFPLYSQFYFYGRGWFTQDMGGNRTVWHTGAIDGMRAYVGLMPEKQVGFVILTNSEYYNQAHIDGIAMQLFDHYLGLPKKDWCAIFLKMDQDKLAKEKKKDDELIAKRVSGTHPSIGLREYAGKYHSDVYGDIEIGLNAGVLTFAFGPKRSADLSHWNYDTFKLNWKTYGMGDDTALVTFSLDSQGRVELLAMETAGTFKRVQPKPETAAKASTGGP